MPAYPSKIDARTILKIINSEEFKSFHEDVKICLGICDINYCIQTKNIAFDNEGFGENDTRASTIFTNNYTELGSIAFYVDSIVDYINTESGFSRIPNNCPMFYEVCITVLKYLLVHELVHVKQFYEDRITAEIVERMGDIPYKEREIEIEADCNATRIIGGANAFNARIAAIISSRQHMDNNISSELYTLYQQEKSQLP